jgi:hypothetical protein
METNSPWGKETIAITGRLGRKFVGPFATTKDGLQRLSQPGMDLLSLDVARNVEQVSAIAEKLRHRHISFFFATR